MFAVLHSVTMILDCVNKDMSLTKYIAVSKFLFMILHLAYIFEMISISNIELHFRSDEMYLSQTNISSNP